MLRGAMLVTILLIVPGVLATEPATSAAVEASTDEITDEIAVSVKGMACPFCAYGIEKSLEKLEGVDKVEVDLEKSQATLQVGKDSAPDDEAIRRAVREAGFTPGEIRRAKAQASAGASSTRHARLRVEGMRCECCVGNINSALERRDGVISATVDLEAKRAVVEYDPVRITPEEIARTIEQAGKFEVLPERGADR